MMEKNDGISRLKICSRQRKEMDGRKTLKLTNQNQFHALVELMQKNEQLAIGFLKGIHKTDIRKEWNLIAEQLNSKGPPIRDGDGWQKVWADMKFKVKKKIIHNTKEINATGGGPNQLVVLSPLEDAVANLLSFKKWLNPSGIPIGVSQSNFFSNSEPTASGLTSEKTEADTPLHHLEEIVLNEENSFTGAGEVLENQHVEPQHETAEPSEPAGKKRRHASAFKSDRAKLLEKQSVLQEITLNGINESLKKIEGYAKKVERYTRKSYKLDEERAKRDIKRLKIEEENLFVYKQEMERKLVQTIETNKIKMMDLEIKRKQIQIKEKKQGCTNVHDLGSFFGVLMQLPGAEKAAKAIFQDTNRSLNYIPS